MDLEGSQGPTNVSVSGESIGLTHKRVINFLVNLSLSKKFFYDVSDLVHKLDFNVYLSING